MKIDIFFLKSKIEEIYEDKKHGEGWAAWSALCMWLAQYEHAEHSVRLAKSRWAKFLQFICGFSQVRRSEGSSMWTTETPTVEGFYWVIGKNGRSANSQNVELLFFDGHSFCVAHDEYWYKPEFFSHFLGPIEPPKLPTHLI